MLLNVAEYTSMALTALAVGLIVVDSTASVTVYTMLAYAAKLPPLVPGEQPPTGLVLAFALCVGASSLTVLQIANHLTHYFNPKSQRYVIRILFMVPIYAIDSFWGYLHYTDSSAIAVARDTYESYVLYNFFALLMEMLGGPEECAAYWKSHKMITMRHSFPFCYVLPDMVLGVGLLRTWKLMLVQYMLLSPIMTLLTYVMTFEGLFDENSYSLENAHFYISMIRGVSVTFAFTSLFYLYLSTKHHIHDHGPTGKFISIKFVVFLGFWQGIVIWLLGMYNVLPSSFKETMLEWAHDKEIAENDAELAFGNLLLCGEMVVTALMHHVVFSYQEYVPKVVAQTTKEMQTAAVASDLWANAQHAISVWDVAADARRAAVGRSAAAAKKRQ
jgi:hypothetical protein